MNPPLPAVDILVPHKEFPARLTREGWAEWDWEPGQELPAGAGVILVPNMVLISREQKIVVDPGPFYVGRLPAIALSWRGLSTRDIDLVIDTHLHTDHAGGNAIFKGKKLIFHEAEYSCHPRTWIDYISDGMAVSPMKGEDMALSDGVRLLHTPGHTPGSISVLVETEEGRVLITGDAGERETEALISEYLPRLLIPGHGDPVPIK
ncbi:MAG: MBL fold metallo-hydrolase [candidate division WOR-3 bacterium]